MITDLQDAENRGFILGFQKCSRTQDWLSIAGFMAGISAGLGIATFLIWIAI